MDRAKRSSRSMRLKAQADRLAVDLILDCERAASRRDPRLCDPTRWSRTAWRRYLYAAAHAPSLADLERVFRAFTP
jgi:hypothetical protein